MAQGLLDAPLSRGMTPRGQLRKGRRRRSALRYARRLLILTDPREHPLEARGQLFLDIGPALQPAQQHPGSLDGRQSVAAGLATQLAAARRPPRAEHHATAFEHPRIAPPQGLGLAPGAVQQHDALDVAHQGILISLELALAVEKDDLAVGREARRLYRAEIKDRPAMRVDGAAENLAEARPRQA